MTTSAPSAARMPCARQGHEARAGERHRYQRLDVVALDERERERRWAAADADRDVQRALARVAEHDPPARRLVSAAGGEVRGSPRGEGEADVRVDLRRAAGGRCGTVLPVEVRPRARRAPDAQSHRWTEGVLAVGREPHSHRMRAAATLRGSTGNGARSSNVLPCTRARSSRRVSDATASSRALFPASGKA